jgi:hypothetical protein
VRLSSSFNRRETHTGQILHADRRITFHANLQSLTVRDHANDTFRVTDPVTGETDGGCVAAAFCA